MALPLFSPSGPHSLKSSRTSSVRTARVVAVAQSKLTFVKPVQTGTRRLRRKTSFRPYSSRDVFLFTLVPSFPLPTCQPFQDTQCHSLPRTCSMTRGGLRSRSEASRGGSTTSSLRMTLKSTLKLPKVRFLLPTSGPDRVLCQRYQLRFHYSFVQLVCCNGICSARTMECAEHIMTLGLWPETMCDLSLWQLC